LDVGCPVLQAAARHYSTGKRGAGNREADGPAGSRQQAGGQTGEGFGNGRADRQARGRKQGSRQAGKDSTKGEGQETGRISVEVTVQELRESSVSTRDDLAETEWRGRIYLEQGWAIIFPRGPNEQLKIFWRAGPKCRTQLCIIYILFLYKKQ
jgi:hypothetical protein